MISRSISLVLQIGLILSGAAAIAADRPTPPTRDPHTPGYVEAKELPDGEVPPVDAEGNFIIGPTHPRAPEMNVEQGVPQGTIHNLTMNSTDSKIYPGIARDPDTRGTPDPNDPSKLIVTTSRARPLYAPRGGLRAAAIRAWH